MGEVRVTVEEVDRVTWESPVQVSTCQNCTLPSLFLSLTLELQPPFHQSPGSALFRSAHEKISAQVSYKNCILYATGERLLKIINLFNTASSAAPQIPLCRRRMLQPNSQSLTWGRQTTPAYYRVVVPARQPMLPWRAGTTTLRRIQLYPPSQGL